MPIKYRFKLKSWKLATLAAALFAFFIFLGCWQLSRAQQKTALLSAYAAKTTHAPFSAKELNTINDWRFYRAELKGTFDNEHTFLLDNKTYEHQIGYEVYTPMHVKGMREPILVDRGFISMGENRDILPAIRQINGEVTILGMLNLPPIYMTLGNITDPVKSTWPLRVEYINLAELANLLKYKLFPYTLVMDPKDPRAYPVSWQVVIMAPERHVGYAVQWFALALTLLILFVALNREK